MDDEEILEQIEPNIEDFMSRRMNHIPFAKVIYWLYVKSQKNEFVYSNELAHYTKVSNSRAYCILRDLCNVKILVRKQVGSLVEFHFSRNGDKPIVGKYIDRAKKTLELN